MKPTQLVKFLQFAIPKRFNVLIKGKPGIGKSDIVAQAAEQAGAELIIAHPVVSDPTDFKGLPFAQADGTADFLPFGELKKLINAKTPTVFFLDDLGQAPPSVQAAVMQLLLARRVNGHKVSDKVSFIAATNRREDKAGVQGLLEPVKSRFASIVELDVNNVDWLKWAAANDMPVELQSFMRFRPDLLDKAEPTKDIINSPSPRTIAAVGRMQNEGLDREIEFEVIKGAVGEGFALEYNAFLKLFRELPDLDGIIANPKNAIVPTDPGTQYALSGALGHRMDEKTIAPIMEYIDRLPKDVSVATVKIGTGGKKEKLQDTKAFTNWAVKNADIVM